MTDTNKQRVSLDLPEDLVEEIEAAARERTLGRGILIENMLRFALACLKPVTNLFTEDEVTIRTGGVVVGRRNRSFDLDVTTLVLDLARRGYQVYVRGEGPHANHYVFIAFVHEQLVATFCYGTIVMTVEQRRGWGEPEWWAELATHLRLLLTPTEYENRITNYPLDREESNAEHIEASEAR